LTQKFDNIVSLGYNSVVKLFLQDCDINREPQLFDFLISPM